MSGIGRQVAVSFAAQGCEKIALLDYDELNLANTEALIGATSVRITTLARVVDTRIEESVAEAVQAVIQKFDRIDYAVNAAGKYLGANPSSTHPTRTRRLIPIMPGVMEGFGNSYDVETREFDNLVSTNFRGTWLCCREEAKIMVSQTPLPTHDSREGSRGAIVNVSSMLAHVGHQSLCKSFPDRSSRSP